MTDGGSEEPIPVAGPPIAAPDPERPARRSNGHAWPLPAARAQLAVERSYGPDEMTWIRAGLAPLSMDDRWFLYWQGRTLHCLRSWTGFCVFEVRFEEAADGSARIVEALANRDPQQYQPSEPDEDGTELLELIDTLLLGPLR